MYVCILNVELPGHEISQKYQNENINIAHSLEADKFELVVEYLCSSVVRKLSEA